MAFLTLGEYVKRFGHEEVVRAFSGKTRRRVEADELKAYLDGDASPSRDVGIIVEGFSEVAADVERELEVYLVGGGYSRPIEDVPQTVVAKGCDMLRYNLLPAPNAFVERKYTDALAFFKGVNTGRLDTGLNAEGKAPTRTAPYRYTTAENKVLPTDAEKRFLGY